MHDLDQLGARLREAGRDELERLLGQHLAEVGSSQALQALANPFITQEGIARLLDETRLLSDSSVREALVRHPRTPRTAALSMVHSLYWRQLVSIGRDTSVHPVVRRAAENAVRSRLPGLASGERMAIARLAGGRLLQIMAADPDARVIAALLDNPRLREQDLTPILTEGRGHTDSLQQIASHRRWSNRPTIRRALCLNSRTPALTALTLLPSLSKGDLEAVLSARQVCTRVRQRAAVLLGTSI